MKDLKNKIKHFSKGDFQIGKPDIIFPETKFIFKLGEGEIYHGSFMLQNKADGDIRGLVYPSSFRVHCAEQGFEGNNITIKFTYDGTGLPPGHVENGKFTVVCNGGEYDITFTAIIEKPYVMTTHGKVQNMEDFKRLAFTDFAEAQKLFRSKSFYEVLKYEDERIRNLYNHMRKWSLSEQGLEEFLVGIKQKEKLFLTLKKDGKEFSEIMEAMKDTISVTKNTWGFLAVNVIIKGDFIKVNRNSFSTDDFIGNSFELEYVIRDSKLHKGCNFGQIIFETPYESLVYSIEVTKKSAVDDKHRLQEIKYAQLIKSYLELEAKSIHIDDWIISTKVKINELQQLDPSNEWLQLLQAHVYIISNRIEEAGWILENYNYNRFAIGKNIELSSYYLFLTALVKKDNNHTKKVLDELQKSYLKNAHSWKLLCMMIELDPHYKDSYERLHVLERQFYNGANQLLFYLEAFQCFRKKSSNLKKLGTFEVHVLAFANKYKLMTKDLALYTANLASQQKKFDKNIYKILVGAYDVYEEPMILTAICTMLVKGNQVDCDKFKWYKRAVDAELKIAQLYEYYMASVNPDNITEALPRTVHLYFMHGNSLEYQKAALLYANLISFEDETSELFAHYRDEIELFAWEQLEKRHINNQLRIIYKRFLTEQEMNSERIQALRDICYAYEIKTKVSNMKYVLIIEKDGEIRQKVPYTSAGVQVTIEDKETYIVWESTNGNHYIGSIPYETKRLFYEVRFMDMCKKHMQILQAAYVEEEQAELTFELLKVHGIDAYEERDVFCLCSKKIREDNYEEEDFLTYVCFELFKKEQYDKVMLTYLANYYCGATRDMKMVWYIARDYEVNTCKLAERIITQMLFSEVIFGEAEIFEDYYEGGAYFRLKLAYLAFVSREYIVKERELDVRIVGILRHEFEKGEELLDVSKIALLKYYVHRAQDDVIKSMLKKCMQILCEKQIFFPLFLEYDEEWLREFQIWDKTMIEYHAEPGSKVKISYQLQKEGEETLEYHTEVMVPMFENIFVKTFVLFEEEILKYYINETRENTMINSVKQEYKLTGMKKNIGKYGKLNEISGEKEERVAKMYEYALEEKLANEVFLVYE